MRRDDIEDAVYLCDLQCCSFSWLLAELVSKTSYPRIENLSGYGFLWRRVLLRLGCMTGAAI